MASPFLWYRIQTSPGIFSIREIKGVIFDLDGTLTVPVLDFAKMRSLLGIPRPHDILEVINQYDEEKRAESLRLIDTVEEEGRGMKHIFCGNRVAQASLLRQIRTSANCSGAIAKFRRK